jgi:hypothetical protein
LFDTSDGCVLVTLVGTVFVQSGVNLTSAENDTIDFVWFGDGVAMLRVWDNPLELRFASEFLDTRSGNRVTEQRLRKENNES